MEFKSMSAKLTRDEVTTFKAYCERKGITPSALIRELILDEMGIAVPSTIAGQNKLSFKKEKDSFSWSVVLDDNTEVKILENVSPGFLQELNDQISLVVEERNTFIQKKKKKSVAVPSTFLRGKK